MGVHQDTSHDGWSMLHYAAQWDRVKIIELLLNHGADPQQRDWTGKTPIKLAKVICTAGVQRLLMSNLAAGARAVCCNEDLGACQHSRQSA